MIEKTDIKRKQVKPMSILIIIILISIFLGILYLFTPFGFFDLKLDGEYQMMLTINDHQLTATMENNTSAQALKRILQRGPKTINMRDYESMEKVGMLWKGLPTNNQNISTQSGDLILFMGSSFVIYYDTNHWNFTKLGHINDVTQSELIEILGQGDVKVTLSLK